VPFLRNLVHYGVKPKSSTPRFFWDSVYARWTVYNNLGQLAQSVDCWHRTHRRTSCQTV